MAGLGGQGARWWAAKVLQVIEDVGSTKVVSLEAGRSGWSLEIPCGWSQRELLMVQIV